MTSPASPADGGGGGNMFKEWLSRATPLDVVLWGLLLGTLAGTALFTLASGAVVAAREQRHRARQRASAAAVAVTPGMVMVVTRCRGPLERQLERGRRGQVVGVWYGPWVWMLLLGEEEAREREERLERWTGGSAV